MHTDLSHVVNIPPAKHLETEFTRISALGRNDAVAALKVLKQTEFEAIAKHQLDHINEITGIDVVTQITAMIDGIVRELSRRAFLKVGAPADWVNEVGVFAVGGYGRGEMNPRSDIDLLVLSTGKPAEWKDKGYAELQASLWDVKFQVGASHRHASELTRIVEEDFVTGTAIIESRPLLTAEPTDQAMQVVIDRFQSKRASPFLRYKIEELEKRRSQAGVSLFLMEPNLKSNPGGLRDVQLLRNIAFAIYGSRNLYVLAELDSITRRDLNDVLQINSHLLNLRSLLHFHHGRKQDVLQLADQVRIARQFGYGDISQLRAVEHFMRQHYIQVRQVHQVVDLACSRLEALGHLGRKKLLITTRKRIDDDFTSVDAKVYLSHGNFWKHADAGHRLIRMCRVAQERGLRLSLELQRSIRANLEVMDDSVRHDGDVARAFLALLGDIGKVAGILHDMHDCGLLGAYVPEFGNLTCHMQFDSYHQYTVDEHTLLAMRYLDDVGTGRMPGLPGMARILPLIKRKDLLALSLLLHDMGKYMGRGHVARGAIMVSGVAHRLGLSRDEEDLVYFLVERHVALSDASRMRDFREPSFLTTFAERIGTRDNLDALYCLTFCDAKAVGEGIMTGWQESLLGELYQVVADKLAGDGSASGTIHQRLRHAFTEAGVPTAQAEAFFSEFSGTYEYQVQPSEAVRHFRVLHEARATKVGLLYEVRENHVLVTAAIRDRHGLLADVASALSGHGFDIIDARSWIAAEGIAIYSWRLTSIYPARIKEADSWKRLREDLAKVADGTMDTEALLARRRSSVLTNKPADSGFDDPAVKVEQRTSDDHTIVDVHTKDQVGLLGSLCRTISAQGCDIGYTCINTMGDVAVDVFYVSRGGRKLADDDAAALRARLVKALEL